MNEKRLFVGLGGCGLRAINKIQQELGEKYSYLVIDSDISSLNYFPVKEDIYSLYDPTNPIHINSLTQNGTSAFADRNIGRTFLFSNNNYEKIYDIIANKISKLNIGNEDKCIITIISGIAGGTGGGILVDIAYMVRRIINTYANMQCEIEGCILALDTHKYMINLSLPQVSILKRNYYSTLKDIIEYSFIEDAINAYAYPFKEGEISSHTIFDHTRWLSLKDGCGNDVFGDIDELLDNLAKAF